MHVVKMLTKNIDIKKLITSIKQVSACMHAQQCNACGQCVTEEFQPDN